MLEYARKSQLVEAHAWLAAHREPMVKDLMELANQNSGSNNVAGLHLVAQWIEDWMSLPMARFRTDALAPRHILDERGAEIALPTGALLQWQQRPEAERKVLLGIHYDTVYGVDHPLQVCTRASTERLTGPGVADAKGGIVVMRYALQALERFELAREVGWTVFLNPDEELGSPSSAGRLRDLAREHDFGLLFEPAFPDGSMVAQRKGSGSFTVVVRGRSAHAGRNREQGRNAITHLSRLVTELDDLNGQRDGVSINIGHVMGGGPVNVVPDLASARLNVRVSGPESQTWFQERLDKSLAKADTVEGFSCRLHGGFHAPAKLLTPPMKQLMHAVELAASNLGQSVNWTATGGVSDGNKLAAAGLPNIDTLGPIGDGLHSADESVSIDSLVAKASLVVELIAGFSAGRFESLSRQDRGVGQA